MGKWVYGVELGGEREVDTCQRSRRQSKPRCLRSQHDASAASAVVLRCTAADVAFGDAAFRNHAGPR